MAVRNGGPKAGEMQLSQGIEPYLGSRASENLFREHTP